MVSFLSMFNPWRSVLLGLSLVTSSSSASQSSLTLFFAQSPSPRALVLGCHGGFIRGGCRAKKGPEDEALERLAKLETIMLKVVANQADKIKELQRQLNAVQEEVAVLSNAAKDGLPTPSETPSDQPGVSAEEAFGALADVLLRVSSDPKLGGYVSASGGGGGGAFHHF